MIVLVLSSLTVLAAATSVLVTGQRAAILASGLMGVLGAGVFISVGAETLAWVQALLSVMLVGIGYVMGLTTGETPERPEGRTGFSSAEAVRFVVAAVISLCFGTMLWAAFHFEPNESLIIDGRFSESLIEIGSAWVNRHFIAIQVASVMFLLALIGVGAVARLERSEGGGEP